MKSGLSFSVLLILLVVALPPLSHAQMERLFVPSEDEYGSVTGWNHRYPGIPSWVPGTIWQEIFNRKYVELAPGERYTLVELDGPGIVNRIFFTLPVRIPANNLRALVLRIYWDDEDNASVVAPLGDFFGAPFGRYTEYDSQPMSMHGGGVVCRFLMPFRKRARIEIENGWDKKADLVFFGINWYKVPELPDDILYFHALWRRTNLTIEGEPHLVADIKGQGNFVGVQLFLQNRSDFLFKDLFSLMQPEGFGMGNLEGWEEIFIDGSLIQHGTGTEEYFNAGAYFVHTPYSGMYEGVHMRSYLTGRTSTYRFHVLDPIPFSESFRMIWHHGLLDSIRSDYSSIAYWYQAEPHTPQAIPGLEGRMPVGTGPHILQALILSPLVFGNKLLNDMMFE